MKKIKEEIILTKAAAEPKDSIDAEKEATFGMSHTGEENSFDAESTKDREAEFEELITGKYKEEFARKVHKIISRRIKEVKSMKEEAQKNARIVRMLMEKFNIEDEDTEKLERMIDTQMNTTAQLEKERSNELLQRLIAQNNYLKRMRDEEAHKALLKSRREKLRAQAEEAKKAYPDFDFEAQLKSEEFRRLIKAGVSVKNAYEVVNIDAILDKNSKNAEKMVVDSIRSKGNRPVENGSAPTGGILLSSDISKLTKKERAELAKRAAKGERIEF